LEVYRIFLRFKQKKCRNSISHSATAAFSAIYCAFLTRSFNTTYRRHGRMYHKRNKYMFGSHSLEQHTHTVQDIRSNPPILTAVPIDISRSSCWQVMRNYVALWQNRQLYPPGEVSVRCATAVDMVAGKQPGDPRINNGSQRYTTCE